MGIISVNESLKLFHVLCLILWLRITSNVFKRPAIATSPETENSVLKLQYKIFSHNLYDLTYCWASKMKTRWLPLQVQSSYTVLSLNPSFLKEMFHHNFTREHNNSLLSIIGYTLSIQGKLSSLPLTTVLPACAAPGFRWNGHGKREVDMRNQIPYLKSYSTGSLLRYTGNRQHCSDTN